MGIKKILLLSALALLTVSCASTSSDSGSECLCAEFQELYRTKGLIWSFQMRQAGMWQMKAAYKVELIQTW